MKETQLLESDFNLRENSQQPEISIILKLIRKIPQ